MSQIEFTASHFNRVYWALDNFKQWLTFIQLVKYAPSRWDAAVVSEADEFQKFLDSELLRLVEHVAIFHETFTEADAHTIREFELVEKNILKLDEKGMPENLGRAFSQMLYDAATEDLKWYSDYGCRFGNFWNDVPLPKTVEKAFCTYVKLFKFFVPGMIGPEEPENVPEGAFGLSFYDLSNYVIVFKDEQSLNDFADRDDFDVDPVDRMEFNDGGWFDC